MSPNDFTIFIPSCDMEKATKTAKCLEPHKSVIFNGIGYPSFSKLINDCIIACPTETIIIANDKVRGDSTHIDGILSLLESGYGLASYYRFGFFGFNKELIRHVGLFDENFQQGGYEDVDFKNRLIEADIGIYEDTSCPYEESGSRWKGNDNKAYYESKWWEKIGRPYCNYCKKDGSDIAYDFMSCHQSNVIIRRKEEPAKMSLRLITEMDIVFHNYTLRMQFPKSWKESVLPANNKHLLDVRVLFYGEVDDGND